MQTPLAPVGVAILTVATLLLTALSAHADSAPALTGKAARVAAEVEGLWATGGSLVRVSQSDGTLHMIVVALEEPLDATGEPLKDRENPDKALRDQPILGMDLLSNYKFSGKRWEGKIYDPESGSLYSSRMKLKDGFLEMRGYIGTPLLGKTKKFKPISVCRADMLVMLANSNITGYCGL